MNDTKTETTEERRSREVDELIARTRLTRKSIENGGSAADLDEIINKTDAALEFVPEGEPVPYDIATEGILLNDEPCSDSDPGPDWAEKLGEEYKAAENPANGLTAAASVIADNLVPEFGATLKKYESTAIAFGFPPAVDALIVKAKLDEHRTALVLNAFRNAYSLAAQWKSRAMAIVVQDESETALMAEAKELHRIVRDERINVEKKRKAVKDPALRECQLIDGVANVYKSLLDPIESHLLAQSKFAEIREKEKRTKLAEDRGAKLALFEVDPKLFPGLGDMTDEAFEFVYAGVREQYHAKKEAEKAAERERLERERAAQIENERLRAENERLAKEKAEADEREAVQKRLAAEAELKHKAAQAELDRQAAERRAEEERLAAVEEARRLAPDKEKLTAFAQTISGLEFPAVDAKFDSVLAGVRGDLNSAIRRLQLCSEEIQEVANA